ncbi:MAG: hypothetical protein QF704_01675 [Anaerolineales bacterium]|nr:hypothetical protein [Anaerolineales bacterium]
MAQSEQDAKVSQNTNVEPQDMDASVEVGSMTKSDLDALLNERLESLSSQWQARIDQRATKLEMGLQKRLGEADGLISQLEKQGVNIDDAAQQALRNEIIQEAYRQPDQNPGMSDDEIKSISNAGQQMITSFGLAESDPEWSSLVTDGTPEDYFNSIAEAGRNKINREQGGGDGAPAQAAVPSGGGRPAGAGAPPNPFAVSLDQLYDRANSGLRKKAGL